MNDIQNIYKMLNWENTAEVRAEGFRLARKENNLSLLIMPPAPPSVWEACAQVLSEKTDAALEPYLNSLFEWLYDYNWPGTRIILDRLKIFSGERMKKTFIKFYTDAINMNNRDGLVWLDILSELLDNESLKAVLPKEIIEKLQKHYKNNSFWEDEFGNILI
jgi:hypothetical protein